MKRFTFLVTAVIGTVLVAASGRANGRASAQAAWTQQSQPAAETADISGKWHFVYNTDGGDREANAVFKLDGNQVSGKWESGTDVKGTYKDGDLDLAFPYNSEEAGMTATLKMKGKLKDGKLVGNWEFADYSGTFTGTRSN
jgi:hypothetical protein